MAAAAPSAVAKAGTLTETHSKALLSAAGFPTPEGAEASTVEEAIAIATRVGYPVALKAQAADLPHKSDVGGVVLNVADEAGLRQSWRTLHDSVANARPDLTLDGVLVERMGARGLEMIVSARRDPQWGVVLMAGVGGVWIEALDDVRLMPADLSEAEIVAELKNLRAAKLLDGIRGAPPADVSALSGVLLKLGDLMYADPGIDEVEINPLVVYPRDDGAVVLDALITIGSVA
ncbi:MAG: acetate--CoA ligase family protein [Terricaulis sp.]|nr:acetate--CoA ligase family protein [Terricaulis sp.]